MDKVLQTVSRPFLQSLCRVRRHDASQLPYEFLHPFIRGAPSDDHRPRHSLFIGIGGLRRRCVAFLALRLDLLLLRLVFGWCGGPVGLRLRARLLAAASSARHAGGSSLLFASSVVRCAALVQLLCRLQAVQLLLCGTRGFKARSSDGALRLEYARAHSCLSMRSGGSQSAKLASLASPNASKVLQFLWKRSCLEVQRDA